MVGAIMLMGGLFGAAMYTGVMVGLITFVDRDALITWSVYMISVGLMLVIALLGYVALTAPTPQHRQSHGESSQS